MGARQHVAGTEPVVIDRRFLVMPDTPRGTFAGLPAVAAEQRPGPETSGRPASRALQPLLAVRTRRDAPPRVGLATFFNAYNTSLLMPLAHGAGAGEFWIVCDAPPGPSLAEAGLPTAVTETELAAVYLRPLALALGRLHGVGLTHRALRPANLYRSEESGRILLAPGCVMPPAYGQPVLYEPPAVAICPPANRGSGTPADDIYALGVLLLELTVGHPPMAGLDDEQILRRKLELGSFQALAMGERLPPVLVSLLRAMLCDDPQGRPDAAGLAENGIGAERPKAPRPEARAPRPLMVGRTPVSSTRMLAAAFAAQPAESRALLQGGTIDQWLRRALEQPLVAGRIDEAMRLNRERPTEGAESMTVMQTVALLDPLAPMLWSGVWFWPDAAPSMLAAQMVEGGDADIVTDALRHGALRRWAILTGRNAMLVVEDLERRSARAARLPVPSLRPSVLAYSLNPFLACISPALGGACVLQPDQLLGALEATAAGPATGSTRLLDPQMLALLAARSDPGQDNDPGPPVDADDQLLDLHALARAQLQSRSQSPPSPASFPRLASRLLPSARERLRTWPGKGRRTRRLDRLEQAASLGDLVAMLELSCQDTQWAADDAGLREARQQADRLRAATSASVAAAPVRARAARAAGREVAVVAGLIALAGAAVVAVAS